MKNVLLAACAVVALGCSSALAADALPRPVAVAPPPVAVVVVPNFTGIYAGALAGGIVGAASSITLLPTSTQSDSVTTKFDNNGPAAAPGLIDQNVLFGGFIGANYQIGGWVLGAEGDISRTYAGTQIPVGTSTTAGAGPFTRTTAGGCQVPITGAPAVSAALATSTGFDCTDNLMWVATARGKVGYALGSFMLYGTGGFAWGSVRRLDQEYTVGTTNTQIAVYSQQSTGWGWTAGFGIDYLAAQNLVIGSDVLFVDLNHSGSFTGNGTFATEQIKMAFTMIRAKAALKFP